jgi:hypothetical protein
MEASAPAKRSGAENTFETMPIWSVTDIAHSEVPGAKGQSPICILLSIICIWPIPEKARMIERSSVAALILIRERVIVSA